MYKSKQPPSQSLGSTLVIEYGKLLRIYLKYIERAFNDTEMFKICFKKTKYYKYYLRLLTNTHGTYQNTDKKLWSTSSLYPVRRASVSPRVHFLPFPIVKFL